MNYKKGSTRTANVRWIFNVQVMNTLIINMPSNGRLWDKAPR